MSEQTNGGGGHKGRASQDADVLVAFPVLAQNYAGKTGTVVQSGIFDVPLPANTELVVVRYDDGTYVIWRAQDLAAAGTRGRHGA